MNKKTILFIGLMVCFLVVLGYVEKIERDEIASVAPSGSLFRNDDGSASRNDVGGAEIASAPAELQQDNGGEEKTAEKYEKTILEESSIEQESCLIPLIAIDGWQTSGPFANLENCEENKFFSNRRPCYCSLAGLKDSYSVFWKKDATTKEEKSKSFMYGTIFASIFEFSDANSALIENVIDAHNMNLKFLQDFELQGVTIQRQEFKYGIRLVSKEEAEELTEQEIQDKTIMIVSYFDVFVLDDVVFVVCYDSDHGEQAKIIEKAIITN